MTEEPMLYTIKAFCLAHGMGETTFHKLKNAGQLDTIVAHGRRLIPVESARAYRERHTHKYTLKSEPKKGEERRRPAKATIENPPLRQWSSEGRRRAAKGY